MDLLYLSITQSTSSEINHWQSSQLGSLPKQIDRNLYGVSKYVSVVNCIVRVIKIIYYLELLGIGVELRIFHRLGQPDLTVYRPSVLDSIDNIPCEKKKWEVAWSERRGFVIEICRLTSSGLSLGPDHCCSFSDSPQSFAEIPCSTDKGNLELALVNMVLIVSRRKH